MSKLKVTAGDQGRTSCCGHAEEGTDVVVAGALVMPQSRYGAIKCGAKTCK